MPFRRTLTALAVSVLLLLTGCGTDDATPTSNSAAPQLVAPAEAVELIAQPDTVVLDVRTPEEFAQGHVEGARNVDINGAAFRDQLDGLDRQAPYVMYCRSGNRSAAAVDIMQEMGFVNVADAGGFDALAAAGAPRA